jgi:glycosyltransferase involved in cell wall biosynthesis
MLVYLSPAYRPYRIPVFQSISRRLSSPLHVISLDTSQQRAVTMRYSALRYVQHFVRGTQVTLAGVDSGTRSPCMPPVSWDLRYLLKQLHPEAVISNNLGVWTATSIALGIPTTVFWEGTQHSERTIGTLRHFLRKWIVRRAEGFVVSGLLAKRYLIDKYGVPEKLIFTGGMCSSPPPPAQAAESIGLKTEPKHPVRFLFSGALTPLKQPGMLVHAAAALKATLRDSKSFAVTILGQGRLDGELRTLVSSLGLSDLFALPDGCPADQVWDYYRDNHVLVHPTLHDNWPLVVPEAMSMALPVLLSSRSGNVPDLLREAENGFTFDPTSTAQLCERMRVYVESPKLINMHGMAGHRIVQEYTPARAATAALGALGHDSTRKRLIAEPAPKEKAS